MQFEANFWHEKSCPVGWVNCVPKDSWKGGGVVSWRNKVKQVRREEIVTAKPRNITIIYSLLDAFAETAKTAL